MRAVCSGRKRYNGILRQECIFKPESPREGVFLLPPSALNSTSVSTRQALLMP